MKITRRTNRARAGFTLIEMIGVLAVIAILAALLIPKIFEAISNARVNNAAVNCQTVKTAIADHYAKVGSLAAYYTNSNSLMFDSLPVEGYDRVLLTEGFLDKPFAVKIGAAEQSEDDGLGGTTTTATTVILDTIADAEAEFLLDGETPIEGSHVVFARILGVSANDAKDLNDRIDGIELGEAINTADTKGRVIYGSEDATTVYVYLELVPKARRQ